MNKEKEMLVNLVELKARIDDGGWNGNSVEEMKLRSEWKEAWNEAVRMVRADLIAKLPKLPQPAMTNEGGNWYTADQMIEFGLRVKLSSK